MATVEREESLKQLLRKYGVREEGEYTPDFDRDGPKSARAASVSETRRRPSPIRHSTRTPDEGCYAPSASESSALNKSPKSETSRAFPESRAFSLAMSALQSKVKQLEAENTRLSQENGRLKKSEQSAASALAAEDRARQMQELNAKLSRELREKTAAMERQQSDFDKLLQELHRAKDLIERLQQHNDRRACSDRAHSSESKIRQLEALTLQQKTTIESLRAEVAELREKKPGRRSLSRDENSLQATLKPPLSFMSPIAQEPQEVSNYLTNPDSEVLSLGNSLDLSTRRLEREIDDYNKQYKSLLKKSQEPGADLLSLRVELNSIAAAMEAKSNHLAAVRRQLSRDYGAKI